MHVSRLIRGAIARLQVTADSPPAREDRSR
jgi:hypothetical protein